jgi:hypothetical protein
VENYIKFDLKETVRVGGCGLDLSGSGQGPRTGFVNMVMNLVCSTQRAGFQIS